MRRTLLALALAALAGCASAPTKDHSRLVSAQVRSILVVPVLNRSADVTAPDYFLSTVSIPLAERGYYVFPVNLVKRVLEDDGLGDAGLVHSADPARLASIFGADAVLYVMIERWDAQWILVNTTVTVQFAYVLRDGRTGEELWSERRAMKYSSGNGNQNLLGAIVAAAITKASPSYMPLARNANATAMAYPGPGFPSGPYHPEHGKDWEAPAGAVAVAKTAPPPTSAHPERGVAAGDATSKDATPIATPVPTSTPAPAASPEPSPTRTPAAAPR